MLVITNFCWPTFLDFTKFRVFAPENIIIKALKYTWLNWGGGGGRGGAVRTRAWFYSIKRSKFGVTDQAKRSRSGCLAARVSSPVADFSSPVGRIDTVCSVITIGSRGIRPGYRTDYTITVFEF
ncbi:hypothetical protein ElyMa_001428400 [Elysia marginata]|uniref:Uncharacterized protein n=1 Tax=Elysia marginata TaxID=1093978 RepID=A0AAV4IVR9_9GAST|nr:hypothetical protein ElyMa_001428400 [Elysia marginata]